MARPFVIEDIKEMRRQQGIEDPELRQEIRGLRPGDLVKLTLLWGTRAAPGETLVVRITSIRGDTFRGKLASTPVSAELSGLNTRSPLVFTAAHIHSLPRRAQPAKKDRKSVV